MQENGKIAHYEPDTFRFHGLKLINIDHTNNGSIREELKKFEQTSGQLHLCAVFCGEKSVQKLSEFVHNICCGL